MSYRRTSKAVRCRAPRQGGDPSAVDRVDRWQPPALRRLIEITDYDCGEVKHRIELRRSNRIDCYEVHVDGRLWKKRIGWSRALAGIRKALPRMSIFSA